MKIDYPAGATPLTNDELHDLIPKHITTQGELNEAEQLNIASAQVWLRSQKLTSQYVLDSLFIRKLHKKMFGNVWKWAGKFRQSDKNIGVDWTIVSVELKKLLDDTHFQFTVTSLNQDEIIARFHHRLVWIHPFPNGNGRHARIVTDCLLRAVDRPRFSWGGQSMNQYSQATEIRKQYIGALRQADKGNIQSLMKFVRN